MNEHTQSQSVLSAELEIVGTIKTNGALRIDGKLDGEVQSAGDVTVGNSAVIKGNLAVNSVSIAGTVNGNVVAKDRIEMKSSARVMGDIKAKRLAVEDGVTFVGKSEVNPSGATPPLPAPQGKGPEDSKAEPAMAKK